MKEWHTVSCSGGKDSTVWIKGIEYIINPDHIITIERSAS